MGSVVPGRLDPRLCSRRSGDPQTGRRGPTTFSQGSPGNRDPLLPSWGRTRPACRRPLSWPRPSRPAGLPWGRRDQLKPQGATGPASPPTDRSRTRSQRGSARAVTPSASEPGLLGGTGHRSGTGSAGAQGRARPPLHPDGLGSPQLLLPGLVELGYDLLGLLRVTGGACELRGRQGSRQVRRTPRPTPGPSWSTTSEGSRVEGRLCPEPARGRTQRAEEKAQPPAGRDPPALMHRGVNTLFLSSPTPWGPCSSLDLAFVLLNPKPFHL